MTTSSLHPDTRVLHGGFAPDRESGATALPIVQSSAFAYATAEELEAVFAGREAGYVYSRMGNPTLAGFERRLAALEDGVGAVACASGMAAISATVLALAQAGDEIVAGNSLFGGTLSLFRQTLARAGIVTHLVEAVDIDAYRRAISDRTRLVFLETLGNPKLDVPDLAALAAVTREAGVVLAVDNTLATPLLLQPKTLGVNLILHSTSKFINGHGTAIGGAVIDAGNFDWSSPRYAHLANHHKRFRDKAFLAFLRNPICRDLGGCLAPFNAFLMSVGLESLGVRIERHCANAERVARFLAAHPRVRAVRYPGLPDHPDHALARRQFGGRFGAVLTLTLASRDQAFQFINGLKLAQTLANLGDARTLVIHPASTFCRDLSDADRQAVGVNDALVRLAVGLEHPDDLIADVDQSLTRLR